MEVLLRHDQLANLMMSAISWKSASFHQVEKISEIPPITKMGEAIWGAYGYRRWRLWAMREKQIRSIRVDCLIKQSGIIFNTVVTEKQNTRFLRDNPIKHKEIEDWYSTAQRKIRKVIDAR